MSNIKSLSTTLLILRITQNWWRDKEEYVKLIVATSVKKWHGENERDCHNGRFSCVLGTEMTLISGKKPAMTQIGQREQQPIIDSGDS